MIPRPSIPVAVQALWTSETDDAAKARDLCANAGSGEEECIFGAVRDILNTDPSDVGAARLCQLAKPVE